MQKSQAPVSCLLLCLQVLWLHQTIVPLASSAIERIYLLLLISFGFIVIHTHFQQFTLNNTTSTTVHPANLPGIPSHEYPRLDIWQAEPLVVE
jgi:hypothetical protein